MLGPATNSTTKLNRPTAFIFDTFQTVFDMAKVKKPELQAYGDHIRQYDGSDANHPYAPLYLPESWRKLPAHPDSAYGISRLRHAGFTVCTMSNGPVDLLIAASKHCGITWDAIIPLECYETFKPNRKAYESAIKFLRLKPHEIMMVTANLEFGDLEGSRDVGMTQTLIRDQSPNWSSFQNIEKLANFWTLQ
jgi:FMN phosphatase YigB (HAD superfamily)